MSSKLLSIVLPCRNQEDHIRPVIEAYAGPLAQTGYEHELVVVPNACTDHTLEVVRAAADADPRIRVVENPSGGWGLSVLVGLAACRGSILCYTNSARTDPAQIPPLLALYLEGPPCVAKVRREQRGARFREVGSWLYNLEGRLLFGITAPDVNGTPKILSRDLYERLGLESKDDLLDLELVVKAARLGVPVRELPVQGFRRHGGKSSTNLASAWRMYAGALRLRNQLAGGHGPRP